MDGSLPTHVPTDWVFDALPVPAVVCDLGGVVRAANDAFVSFAGVAVPPGTHWRAFLGPEDCARVAAAAGAALEDDLRGRRHDRDVAVTFRRSDGSASPAELRLRIATADRAKVLVATAHNVEERHRQEHRIAASEQRLRTLASAVPVGVISSHAGIRANYVNDLGAELFGTDIEELVGFGWLDHLHVDDADRMVEALETVVGDCVECELEVRIHRGEEPEPVPMRVRLVPVRAGADIGYVASFEEAIEPDAETVAELSSELRTDPLTGLANRRMLWETLASITANELSLPAACFIDLDDFKQVNDRLGHEAGDAVLRTVADRLRTACRDGDLICRFGGDEFVVLLPHAASDEVALTVGRRIVAAVARPMAVGEEQVEISVSVGVVWTGTPGVDLAGDGGELLRAADIALYKAKRLGKNRAALFDEATRGEGLARREAIAALRALLDGVEHPELRFRPIVPVADEQPTLVEAFVPVGAGSGSTEPDWVSELAAEAGVAPAWDRTVLLTAAAAVLDGRTTGQRLLVSVSPMSLADPEFLDAVASVSHELPVAVAVTERVAGTGDGRALEGIRRLRALGTWVLVRGAGGPGSSFSAWRAVPFDVLELDTTLVEAALSDQTAGATVAGLAAFAARSGAGVVAPAVTTAAQLPLLADLGVTAVSGPEWNVVPSAVFLPLG